MAWISSSVNPLAIRSITVPVRAPERNSCMARTMLAWSRPARRGTGEATRGEAGWHPEHEAAPGGGGSADTTAAPTDRQAMAAATARRTAYTIWMPWFFSGNVRMRLPVAAAIAFSTAGAATQIVGSPTPPQDPPDGMMIDSTLGIWAIRIES